MKSVIDGLKSEVLWLQTFNCNNRCNRLSVFNRLSLGFIYLIILNINWQQFAKQSQKCVSSLLICFNLRFESKRGSSSSSSSSPERRRKCGFVFFFRPHFIQSFLLFVYLYPLLDSFFLAFFFFLSTSKFLSLSLSLSPPLSLISVTLYPFFFFLFPDFYSFLLTILFLSWITHPFSR